MTDFYFVWYSNYGDYYKYLFWNGGNDTHFKYFVSKNYEQNKITPPNYIKLCDEISLNNLPNRLKGTIANYYDKLIDTLIKYDKIVVNYTDRSFVVKDPLTPTVT